LIPGKQGSENALDWSDEMRNCTFKRGDFSQRSKDHPAIKNFLNLFQT
jgi:hypothetical protein